MKLDISKIDKFSLWKLASKTKSIKAKPLVSILVDKSVTSKFLIDTLEGKEPLGDGVLICIGDAGDAWQQMPSNMLKKYIVVEVDKDGWMVCEPKLGNAMDVCEITNDFLELHWTGKRQDQLFGIHYVGPTQWGEEKEGENGYVQYCKEGDFILRDRENKNDFYVVDRKIFLNTYVLKT